MLVADEATGDDWLNATAEWIVAIGCRYVVAWGVACEKWHDAVDLANLEVVDFGDIPADRFIMTTWHDNEPLSEAFWFAGTCAEHDADLNGSLILHVATRARGPELLQAYYESQSSPL